MITDQELIELLNQDEDLKNTYSEKNGWKTLKQTILDLSIDQFFDDFIADEAKFGLPFFNEHVQMYNDVSTQGWKKNVMIINQEIPVVGVPFINKTRATLTLTLH